MATQYSLITNQATIMPPEPPPPDTGPVRPEASMLLESMDANLFSDGESQGEPRMLEIISYKSVGGRSLVKQFSNSWLFNGAPNYLSDAAMTVAERIITAERRMYFDNVHFMRYAIKQLDADGNHVYGETRTETVNLTGATALPVGAVLAPPNIVVRYEKKVDVGRNAFSLFRNAITSDEFNAFTETGVTPARLAVAGTPGGLPSLSVPDALFGVAAGTGLTMMLPINSRYAAGAVRPVTVIHYAGIGFRQETYDRDTGEENMIEAVQQLINENGRKIRRVLRQISEAAGELRTGLIGTLVQLVVDAFTKYGLLTIARRALVRFPAIYFAVELVQLLPPGTIPALPA